MFSLAAKILKSLTRYPVAILVTCFILAIPSIAPIGKLRWELQLQDALSSSKENSVDYYEIEKDFGGLGSLTVVITSDDSLTCYRAAQELAKELQEDSLVHFLDYETDEEFYRKHSLIYIDESDLDSIYETLSRLRTQTIRENNPLYVNLGEEPASDSTTQAQVLDFAELENKYIKRIRESHASADGKIRVVDIYPKHHLSDLQASRTLRSRVNSILDKKEGIKHYFTGKVYNTIQTGRTLLPEAKIAGGFTALFILLLFIIHFYKQPQLILVSAIPAGLPILYTLALAQILFGRINVFTLMLALFLPGQACQTIIHFLNRYFIERSHKLGPQLSIESAVLGIGPSTAASTAIIASLFLTLYLVPVPGLQELGILGAFGCLLNWGLSILVCTSLLRVFQKKKPFSVNSFRFQRDYSIKIFSYRFVKIIIALISIFSFVGLVYGVCNLKFFYDFDQMEIGHKQNVADSLITHTGFHRFDPIIVKLPDQDAGQKLLEDFRELKRKGKIPNIGSIYTLAQFVPQNQVRKKEQLQKIQGLLSKEFLNSVDSINLHNVTRISETLYRSHFEETETPADIRNKFIDIHGNAGVFAYIFSKINPDNGLECRRLNNELRKFEGIEDGSLKIAGTPILRATFLDKVLANVDKTLFAGTALIWIMLLIYYNRLSRAIFTLLPSVFAMGWLVFALKILGIELSAYSSIAFTILFGISVDGSLQLWTAYYHKQSGTAVTILQKKAFTLFVSQMASLIGTYGLLISSHPGLRSIGQICLLGLICIHLSQFLIFPLIAGSLDNYRLRKQEKRHDSPSI